MTSVYDYYPIAGTVDDGRLKEIHNTANGGATLSKFTYSYEASGLIENWGQQPGSSTTALQNWAFGYTPDDELREAVLRDNGGSLVEERSWQYDLVGNRLRQSVGNGSEYWHYNALNQIERDGGAGTTLVEGDVDEPAIVEIQVNGGNYEQAVVVSDLSSGDFLFRREVEVDQGLNTIDVRAEDASGNQSTVKNYELILPAVAKTYEYDLNGNLRFERDSGGSVLREFRWDAQNRLTHVIEGNNETEFEYDGLDRRIRIIERVGGVVQDETTYLWADGVILQRRAADAETLERDYYWSGFSEGSNDYFYTRDHLGSVREVVASDGTTLELRYGYDLWGNVTRTGGTGMESDFRYTGHFYHEGSGLHLAQYRAYNSELCRWLSRDPLESITGQMPEMLHDGPNLYAYVGNDPINSVDLLGLYSILGLEFTDGGGVSGFFSDLADYAGAGIEGASEGAQVWFDQITPFVDPFADSGFGTYDPCDEELAARR